MGIALSVLNALLPKGAFRTIGRLIGGVAMLAVVLHPLLNNQWEYFSWEKAEVNQEINELITEYNEKNTNELKTIIEEKTSAYILDKAKSLGREGEVTVTTKERDGVPYPEEVRLTIPYHEELSRFISAELGIDPSHQFWAEGETLWVK